MRNRRVRARGLSVLVMLLCAGGFLLLGGGALAVLALLGLPPFTRVAPISREGMVAWPATGRSINAYSRVTRDDLADPAGQLNVIWLPRDGGPQDGLRDMAQILGRVLARDKAPGYVFTEADFLPPGTRPGITAGVPPGRRAVTAALTKIRGLNLLNRGDRFDILAALPPPPDDRAPEPEYAILTGGTPGSSVSAQSLRRQTGIKFVVRGAVFVGTLDGLAVGAATAGGLTVPPRSARAPAAPLREAAIAVAPEEVAPLTEALQLNVDLFCVARSGQPGEPEDDVPDLSGLTPYPALARSVPAYARLSEADFADPLTGSLKLYYFRAEDVSPRWIGDAGELIGRVAARELTAGYVLSEPDLLPAGAREGVSGGVPPGKLALRVEADRIAGIDGLKRGDLFDVLASEPLDLRRSFPAVLPGAGGDGLSARDPALAGLAMQAVVRVLVERGQVVDQQDGQATLAVGPDELSPLATALARGLNLYCVVRSGHPEDTGAVAISADAGPLAGVAAIETLRDLDRGMEVFATPRPDESAAGGAAAGGAAPEDSPPGEAPAGAGGAPPSAPDRSEIDPFGPQP